MTVSPATSHFKTKTKKSSALYEYIAPLRHDAARAALYPHTRHLSQLQFSSKSNPPARHDKPQKKNIHLKNSLKPHEHVHKLTTDREHARRAHSVRFFFLDAMRSQCVYTYERIPIAYMGTTKINIIYVLNETNCNHHFNVHVLINNRFLSYFNSIISGVFEI